MKDMMAMMKQAQNLQQKMTDLQVEMENLQVEGVSGGGMVKVMMTAKGMMKSIVIDPALLKPEDSEIVEDLVVAAVNDARARGERMMQEKMQDLTKGLPMPPGMKLF
jgi:nucleoid-associated protein EbfC